MKDCPTYSTSGWCKPSKGAEYGDTSLKGFRGWLKNGLRHVRLPNGRILTKFSWIDSYLKQFEVRDDSTKEMADEILEGIQ